MIFGHLSNLAFVQHIRAAVHATPTELELSERLHEAVEELEALTAEYRKKIAEALAPEPIAPAVVTHVADA